MKSNKDSTSKHRAQLETNTNLLAAAIADVRYREIEPIDEEAETHKRDIDELATRKNTQHHQQKYEAVRAASAIEYAWNQEIEHIDEGAEADKRDIDALATKKADITQHHQQRQEEDETFRADSTNKHKAQLETNTNELATAIEGTGDRELEHIDEGTEAHKRDIDELATSKKAEITQPQQHQQQQEEDEAVRAAIEDAGDQEIQRIDEDAEAHKRDIDELATRNKAEINKHHQQVDEAIRADTTNIHQAQIETNTNMYVTAIGNAGRREIERIDEGAEAHKRDIDELATRKKTEITQHHQQQQQQRQQAEEAFRAGRFNS
ncbi:hypothetical protein MAR_030996 [Mya arenaria]|uniref:Uncharacterized protein n=1 Tax=Mya arenaria TaxID=6604 RepID=A0ABY7F2H8_MYAAR|nr:hypothetical protein MAR_030996 [Mya arenaria]